MNNKHDPVDNALDVLRSQEWAAHQPFEHELENRLMSEFNPKQNVSRFTKPRALVLALALALLTIGGVTFAATGGVEKLKRWFVTIDINGQVTELELDENGEKTFTIETDDGGMATVQIKKSGSPEECEMTQVRVTKTSELDDGTAIENVEAVRKLCMNIAETEFTLDDLGDAEPVKAWTDKAGTSHELYLLPREDAKGSEVLIASTKEDEEPVVRRLAVAPWLSTESDVEPAIEVDENGLVTIEFDDGQGRVQVMKLMVISAEQDEHDLADLMKQSGCGPIKIDRSEGRIQIKVETVEEDE